MKILMLGDIVGGAAVDTLCSRLWGLRRELGCDMVVANGENATGIMGISAEDAGRLLDAGVDVLTGGNHSLHNRSVYTMLDDSPYILRPANLPAAAPGCGDTVFDCGAARVLVLNLSGMMNLEHAGNPFEVADRILARRRGEYDAALVDLHAEATAEKEAMGWYLDGRVTAVVGTHTHVQTADAKILPRGTAYMTDLGMCGPEGGVLGTDRDVILRRFTTGAPQKFVPATGKIVLRGALITCDGLRAAAIERVEI